MIADAFEFERAFHDFARIDRRVVDRALLLALVADEGVLAVEEEEMEFLGRGEADLCRAIIDQRLPVRDHRLIRDLAAQETRRRFAHAEERGDRRVFEPGIAQRLAIGGEHAGKAAEALDQLFGKRLGIAARDAGEEEEFEELVIGQRGRRRLRAAARANARDGRGNAARRPAARLCSGFAPAQPWQPHAA